MKKILSVCLALVMLACISMQAFAQDTPTFAAGSATAYPGDTIEIPILIENNPGIVALSVSVSFDRNVLTLQGASESESVFPGAGITFGGSYDTNSFNILWEDGTSAENYTLNGTIATLTFLINENAPAGDSVISVGYQSSSVVDVDLQDVAFETRSGVVTVLPLEVGGWSFTDDNLYTYEAESGARYICGLDSFDPVVTGLIETTGGWTYEVEANEYGMESTGAKVVIYDEKGAVAEEYYTVLFGDISGDGSFDLSDVSLQMDVMGGNLNEPWADFFDTDEYAQTFAADVSHDLTLDLTDVSYVLDQLGGVEEIDQSAWF